ncbi:carbon-nitrogen hydrolase family protein [Actinocorallia sp. B10E7]|uniref:carbon-nitrogen hydrolase family protein n=1 Tax=Actinocorallia sp. B10E7 TaxID=3153558 RepID=UPI00325ECF26
MREPLVIAVAQPLCTARDVEANAAAHADAIRAARARVVVFPELSLTGYEFGAPALSPDDPGLAAVVEACAETGSLALAGAPVRGEEGRLHIATLAVEGTGVTIAYRKQWMDGPEAELFTPGPAPAVLDVDGWRLGLAICKDMGTPQHPADTAALGMDVYVASVLDSEETSRSAERAPRIAAAYGVPVALSSFAGPTGQGYDRTAGGSGVWSREGERLARSGPGPGAIARVVLS